MNRMPWCWLAKCASTHLGHKTTGFDLSLLNPGWRVTVDCDGKKHKQMKTERKWKHFPVYLSLNVPRQSVGKWILTFLLHKPWICTSQSHSNILFVFKSSLCRFVLSWKSTMLLYPIIMIDFWQRKLQSLTSIKDRITNRLFNSSFCRTSLNWMLSFQSSFPLSNCVLFVFIV